MKISLVLAMCLVTTSAAQPQRLVTLGMTRQQVRLQLGHPTESRGARDSYLRRSLGTEFLLDVGYDFDDSTSRLHPMLRVSSLTFAPDKHRSWSYLASRIPEIRSLCVKGCETVAALAADGLRVDGAGTFIVGCAAKGHSEPKWWENRLSEETCFRVEFAVDEMKLEPDSNDLEWDHLDVTSITIQKLAPTNPLPNYILLKFVNIRTLGPFVPTGGF